MARKIGVTPSLALPSDKEKNALIYWSANLFKAKHTQYMILRNTASLYSMVMYGRGITNEKQFVQETLSTMKEFITLDGNEMFFNMINELEDKNVLLSKMTDRRVTGSINNLIFQTKFHLLHDRKSSLEAPFRLNESSMSYLSYKSPKDEFLKLLFVDGKA
ncbi:DUF6933 domain-containing protein [Syntrophus aciditrophicus]|uniref:Hypothetical cytosolic protein n=1 Tax=Syntrophus aciditrophicus (strain SB) TaxID=56780 RepID=Q2LS64_SYNAS|nr:hypothetical protein [Syntrophus aciditrophicus]ABC76924.1 hypothetical cytosolic protein [Syntrophus aciditrophicus SB]